MLVTENTFYITTLSLAKLLKEYAHSNTEKEGDVEKLATIDAWNYVHLDFLEIMHNELNNTLYTVLQCKV